MSKQRVMMVLSGYPALSQTYKKTELKYLQATHELEIASFNKGNVKYPKHYPFTRINNIDGLLKLSHAFKPDIFHCHYLHYTDLVFQAALKFNKPFTIRTHSFDILKVEDSFIRDKADMINHELCRDVLVFPFLMQRCQDCGIKPEKIIPAMPVVDYNRFYDKQPNGNIILNTGAAIPKKNMESFFELSKLVPQKKFSILPIGYLTPHLKKFNKNLGSPVNVRKTIEPDRMPRVYKKSEWLVYTANPEVPTIGWPMTIDEARASGVGVLIQNIRSDIKDYIDGVGYTFDTIEEATEIIKGPVPHEIREQGFEISKRSDIAVNISQLTDLWK